MHKVVYGTDLAAFFEGKKKPHLARIFGNVGDDTLELSQALSLARHNGYPLTLDELEPCARELPKESGSGEKRDDGEYEVRASEIVEYLEGKRGGIGYDVYKFRRNKFLELGDKPVPREQALRLIGNARAKGDVGSIQALRDDIEDMYMVGPQIVIARTHREVLKGRDRGLTLKDFSPESARSIGAGENLSNDNTARINEGG